MESTTIRVQLQVHPGIKDYRPEQVVDFIVTVPDKINYKKLDYTVRAAIQEVSRHFSTGRYKNEEYPFTVKYVSGMIERNLGATVSVIQPWKNYALIQIPPMYPMDCINDIDEIEKEEED